MMSQPILKPILFWLVLSLSQHDWVWLKQELWILILGSKSAQIEKYIFGTFINFMCYEVTKPENTL